MDNVRVEMLIQLSALSIERSIYAQSQNWHTLPRISVMKEVTVSPFYVLLCSGGVLATTVGSAPMANVCQISKSYA